MLRETHILEPQNVGLYTWREGGLKKVYTHENVNIFGWPLNIFNNIQNRLWGRRETY